VSAAFSARFGRRWHDRPTAATGAKRLMDFLDELDEAVAGYIEDVVSGDYE